MTWHPSQLAQETGRRFVVTGANSGIGLEAARGLVGRGAHVVLAVRDTAKGEEAAAHLDGPGSSSVVELDLSDLDQVADCAQKLLGGHDTLSALVCNAGVMGGRLIASGNLTSMASAPRCWRVAKARPSCFSTVSVRSRRVGSRHPRARSRVSRCGS